MATGRRERKAAERRLRAADFPTHKTLEGIDFAARPSINKMLLCELAAVSTPTGARTCSSSAALVPARPTVRLCSAIL